MLPQSWFWHCGHCVPFSLLFHRTCFSSAQEARRSEDGSRRLHLSLAERRLLLSELRKDRNEKQRTKIKTKKREIEKEVMGLKLAMRDTKTQISGRRFTKWKRNDTTVACLGGHKLI